MPDLNKAKQYQQRHGECLEHKKYLAHHHDPVPVIPVGQHARQRCKQKGRYLAGKADQPKQEYRTGEPVYQPAHGYVLHPGTYQRYTLSNKINPVISRTE